MDPSDRRTRLAHDLDLAETGRSFAFTTAEPKMAEEDSEKVLLWLFVALIAAVIVWEFWRQSATPLG